MKNVSYPVACLAFAANAFAQGASDPDFLRALSESKNLTQMLPVYLKARAGKLLDERERTVAALTAKDLPARKKYVREKIWKAVGGEPARTPLNARTVATIERDGYRIEKVIFESQPKFFVTANLYIPTRGTPPYPAILYPLGHESGAKSHLAWQQMLGSFAQKGYVALAWDTLGQGERVQIYDEDLGGSKLNGSTTEHSMLGAQCLLAGDALARYTIWDGVRALDYLVSRKEVDAARVGCTGNSGGGTHTAYLSALDDRIQVAAPSCYITSWRKLLETIGPQDAEQLLGPFLADGLDHGDFVEVFTGKPYLILSAIRDFFAIGGARATFHEAQRIYDTAGAGAKIAMFEADDGHGFTKPRRLAAYDWFGRWLKGARDEAPEPLVEIATEQELWCTATGQVATSLGGETVWSLNKRRAEPDRKNVIARARELSGYEPASGAVAAQSFGVISRSGYTIEKLTYQSEPGIAIPALIFLPAAVPQAAGKRPAVVYVNGLGKKADAAEGGPIERMVREGHVVLAIDARGFGETRSALETGGAFPRWFGDYESAQTAFLIGKTLVGMRARDIVRAVDLLASRAEVDAARISGFGKQAGGVPMLHAAAFDSRIREVTLDGALVSWRSVVERRLHRGIYESLVPGALKSYDLPDLAAALGRPLLVIDAADPVGQLAPFDQVGKLYSAARVRSRKADGSVPAN